MPIGFRDLTVTSIADGTALTNTVTATSILPAAAVQTIDANWWAVGKRLVLRASGRITDSPATAGNLTLDVRMGGTVVFNGAAMPMDATNAHVTKPWFLELELICRAAGAAGNFFGTGIFSSIAVQTALADGVANYVATLPFNTTPAVGNNVNTTTALTLDLFATWSVASANFSIRTHTYSAELYNI